ncbi:zinc-binding dehydrogenase [Streptomyces tubercidicus]|uniref:zinc-binding dehydrogenase n=1 Tax=Streptomyces tubercidicus TaxID=47759 RepID=UPI0036B68D7E
MRYVISSHVEVRRRTFTACGADRAAVAAGGLRPVVDSVYPLADIASAHRAFERGGVVGEQVVAVSVE